MYALGRVRPDRGLWVELKVVGKGLVDHNGNVLPCNFSS